MEYALREAEICSSIAEGLVLILVLMEYALRACQDHRSHI